MDKKTKLEEELDSVPISKRGWGVVTLILFVLLVLSVIYIVRLNATIRENKESLKILTLEVDQLRLKLETLNLDLKECSSAPAED